MANDREKLLEVNHLEITFHKNGKRFRAVKDCNFEVYKGETFGIVGESGSGKTTIGRAIMRLNNISDGEILFEGKRIDGKLTKEEKRDVVRNIQMIFQDPAASLNERATIDYCISEGLYNFHLYENEEDRERKVDEALNSVGLLPEHKSRYPHEFSGGQRQRLCIARALLKKPKILILDDSTSAVDTKTDAQIRKAFREEIPNTTKIIIAQRISSVEDADRILVLDNGRINGIGTHDALLKNNAIYREVYESQMKGGSENEE